MALLEREQSLRQLADLFARANAGWGQVVFVSGEAGAGKTALVEEFLAGLGDRARVLVASCDAVGATGPFGPLYDVAEGFGPAMRDAVMRGEDRAVLFRNIMAALQASGRATVLVAEDAQWADEATLELIRFLGRRLRGLRAMVVVIHRDELPAFHPLRRVLGDLAGAPGVSRVRVDPLSLDAVSTLLGGAGWDPVAVHARTGGNAFFVTEMVASGGQILPETVRDAVLARVAGLSSEARRLLDAAAIVGGQSEVALLGQVTGRPAEDAIEECLAVGVLVPRGTALGFRHAIMRDVVLSSLSRAQTRTWHSRVLAALRRNGGDAHAGLLAFHADEADDAAAVLEFAPPAARHAAVFGAHREAAELYGRACRHSATLAVAERAALLESWSFECYLTGDLESAVAASETLVKTWGEAAIPLREGDALRWLSRLSWFAGHTDAARAHAREAYRILSGLEPGREFAQALSNLAQLAMLEQDTHAAVSWGEQARALARQLGERAIELHAAVNVGSAQYLRGDDGGRILLEEARDGALEMDLQDDAVRAFTNLGFCAWRQRRPLLAEHYLDVGIAYAAGRDLVAMELYQRSVRALVWLDQGRWAEAEAEASALVGERTVITATEMLAFLCLGRLATLRGADGRDQLARAADLGVRLGELMRRAPIVAARAERGWLLGGLGDVVADLVATHDEAVRRDDGWSAGELAVWLHRAGVEIAEGAHLGPFQIMLSGGDASAWWDEAGCPLEAARARAASGLEDDLRSALATFDRLGAKPDARRTSQALRALGARTIPRGERAATRANPAHLTSRQLDVLVMLATGATNAEIAGDLVLSPKTVDHHVSAILEKLGVTSRRQAVARAQELGMLRQVGG
ncbi:MAG TPA: AAA family ATPase [Propionicimonas sp.]